MNFPERLVINLKTWSKKSVRLVRILDSISSSSFCLENIDVGNDLKYCINEVPNFYPKFLDLVTRVATEQGNDILGNRFNNFTNYKFAELIFSNDFKTITSIRLLGKVRRKGADKIIRYVEFNIPNIFDPNIVYLIYKSDEIISKFSTAFIENITGFEFDLAPYLGTGIPDINKNSFTNFLDTYLLPAAVLHKKDVRPLQCLLSDIKNQVDALRPAVTLNASLSFDDPRRLDQIINQQATVDNPRPNEISPFATPLPGKGFQVGLEWSDTKTYEVIEKEKQIYNNPVNSIQILNQRLDSYDPASPLISFLSEGRRINKKLKNSNNYIECIGTVTSEFFNRIDVCFLIRNVLSNCAGDWIEDFLKTAPLTQFFNMIDNWKNPAIEQFYQFIWSEDFLWGALRKISVILKDYVCIDDLNDKYRTERVSIVLKNLSSQFPQHANTINSIFEQNFSRDTMINLLKQLTKIEALIDVCSWRMPSIILPKLTFKGIYDDFALNIENVIFEAICGLLSSLSQSLINLVLNNLCSLPQFFVDLFMNFPNNLIDLYGIEKSPDEKWQQYVNYCFQMLSKVNNLNMQFTSITDPRLIQVLNSISSTSQPVFIGKAILGDIDECGVLNFDAGDQDSANIPGTSGNEYNLGPTIGNIKDYNYCLGRNNFYTKDVEENNSIQSLRVVSEILKIQKEREEQINFIASLDQGELSQRILQMIKQIQSVLSPRELSMLIVGKYDENIAEIVRMICKINFPSLSDKLDPIKYFIMIGKVLGGAPVIDKIRG
jgi:hypothetical protein